MSGDIPSRANSKAEGYMRIVFRPLLPAGALAHKRVGRSAEQPEAPGSPIAALGLFPDRNDGARARQSRRGCKVHPGLQVVVVRHGHGFTVTPLPDAPL